MSTGFCLSQCSYVMFFLFRHQGSCTVSVNFFYYFALASNFSGYLVSWYIFNNSTINKTEIYRFFIKKKKIEALDNALKIFWKIEGMANLKTCKSKKSEYGKQDFDKTHFRNLDSRYVAEKLFKSNFLCFGST